MLKNLKVSLNQKSKTPKLNLENIYEDTPEDMSQKNLNESIKKIRGKTPSPKKEVVKKEDVKVVEKITPIY